MLFRSNYLENLITQFKDLRQKEKELLGNQKQLIPPEYLKNKLKTIKKNLLTEKGTRWGTPAIKHIKELDSLLATLNNDHTSVNSKKGEQYSYKQGIACFSKIKEAADKECENKTLNSAEIKTASINHCQTITNTWNNVENKINNASNTSYYRTCFTLGLLSGFYIEAEKSSKYLYSKLETFRSEVNKYTDSKLKRVFKFTAPLLAGLVGLAAGITGIFGGTAIEMASAILWLAAQAGYSSSEATESFDEIVRKSKSPQSSEAIEEFIKSVEELQRTNKEQ